MLLEPHHQLERRLAHNHPRMQQAVGYWRETAKMGRTLAEQLWHVSSLNLTCMC